MEVADAAFGKTGLTVSRLGLGCGGLGLAHVSDLQAERLVHAALDLGITFFDAARSYGAAEERLGRALGSRRGDVVISTKGGYGATACADWTAECIRRGIDEARARLQVERIDVFHLHSCPLEVLRHDELHEALVRARDERKIRVAAYSGDNEALAWAAGCATFQSVQCSVNPFNQHALRESVPRAAARGYGVVAKRSLGNAPWRFGERPGAADLAAAWERMQAMHFAPAQGLSWEELALRFTAHAPGVSCAIVGTTSVDHLTAAARSLEAGPLPDAMVHAICSAFHEVGPEWPGIV